MKKSTFYLITILPLSIIAMAQTVIAQATLTNQLDRDLAQFASWYPGQYDNYNQVNFENNGLAGPKPEFPHGRIPQIIHRIENSPLGKYTFYQQQYADGDYEKIYRQRIFIFTPDYETNTFIQKTYSLKNAENFANSHLTPKKLEAVTLEQMNDMFQEGCGSIWRKEGNQFKGDVEWGKCIYDSQRHPGEKRVIHSSNILTKDNYYSIEGGTLLDGTFFFGQKDNVYYHSRKARSFTCSATIIKNNGSATEFKDLNIHDQGKKISLNTATYMRLNQVINPTNENDGLELHIYRDENVTSTASATSDRMTEKINIKLDWIAVNCKATN